jgi:hypothetical protein
MGATPIGNTVVFLQNRVGQRFFMRPILSAHAHPG